MKYSEDKQLMLNAVSAIAADHQVEVKPKSLNNFRVLLFKYCVQNKLTIKTKKVKSSPGTIKLFKS